MQGKHGFANKRICRYTLKSFAIFVKKKLQISSTSSSFSTYIHIWKINVEKVFKPYYFKSVHRVMRKGLLNIVFKDFKI